MAEVGRKIYGQAAVELGYRVMFDGMIGNSERMEKFFTRRFKDWDYYDFPEYTVAVNNGRASEKFKGDRIICGKQGPYHFMFRKHDGFTAKWGRTRDDDPAYCPWGNEIADIEVTTACSGIRDRKGERKPCIFCYKSNNSNGLYMPFDTFKTIFDKMNAPRTMTQIAFGVDAECKTNPDIWKIMDYALENSVVPNVTVADIDDETAKNIVKRCGACAVSCYERDKNRCYDSVLKLSSEAAKIGRHEFKVNMHLLVSHQTEKFVFEVLDDILHDGRLAGLNAVVFLSLKQKGRGKAFSKMDDDVYARVIKFVNDHGISYGSDSCGANRLMKSLQSYYDGKENGAEMYERALNCIEPCESFGMFSLYLNVNGVYYPCSFMEGEGDWKEGIDMLKINDFFNDVWNGEKVRKAREEMLKCAKCNGGCTKCPYYEI